MASVALLSGTAHPALGTSVARALGLEPSAYMLERTPDEETLVQVDRALGNREVAIVQPMAAPVGEHLLDLLLLADACWRVGARTIRVVMPYLAYARQDHRTQEGQALGSRVFAAALAGAHVDRLIVVDPHNPAVEAGFRCPVEALTAVRLLAGAVQSRVGNGSVVVAPDLGATKLAKRYAQQLGLPLALVHKERLGPREVVAEHVIGEVRGLHPILVDDILSTGATMAAAVGLLLARGAKPPVTVVATHGLFAGKAVERLRALPLGTVITTDSVPQPDGLPFAHEVVSLTPLLAEAVRYPS